MSDIDDDVLRALGSAAVGYSRLEALLVHQTAKLIDRNDHGIGLATLAGLDFHKVTQIFEALVFERTSLRYTFVRNPHHTTADDLRKRVMQLTSQLNTVREKRNKIVHAHWRPVFTYDDTLHTFIRSSGVAEGIRQKKDTHKEYVTTNTKWTVAELETLATEIQNAAHELNAFVTFANTLTPLFPYEEE